MHESNKEIKRIKKEETVGYGKIYTKEGQKGVE